MGRGCMGRHGRSRHTAGQTEEDANVFPAWLQRTSTTSRRLLLRGALQAASTKEI